MKFIQKISYSFCDVMNVFKIVVGILIIIAGIYKKDWIGLVGLIPLVDYIHYLSSPKRQKCNVPEKRIG